MALCILEIKLGSSVENGLELEWVKLVSVAPVKRLVSDPDERRYLDSGGCGGHREKWVSSRGEQGREPMERTLQQG